MKAGEASETAQRVAARRLSFSRIPAPYGDPAAEERLARDVAGSATAGSNSPMMGYLAARTVFFDRMVVTALDRGIGQVVIAGAGYDGRALRYAKPGVHWYEIDHPDTQRNKRQRLERLAVDTRAITFVEANFAADDVRTALLAAGYQPDVSSLILCEGVAIYLDRFVLESLLHQLRGVVGDASLLCISLAVSSAVQDLSTRRGNFKSAVAAMGEPARTVMTAQDANALFAATGWRAVTPTGESGAQQPTGLRDGLVVAISI